MGVCGAEKSVRLRRSGEGEPEKSGAAEAAGVRRRPAG